MISRILIRHILGPRYLSSQFTSGPGLIYYTVLCRFQLLTGSLYCLFETKGNSIDRIRGSALVDVSLLGPHAFLAQYHRGNQPASIMSISS